MSDQLIGTTLGQYEIQALLGKGGMSTVYRAYHRAMDRTVALKVLPREFMHDDTFLARFQRESRMVARLEHLHILPVYDVGETDGVPYIAMRYLDGGTLDDLIDAGLPDISIIVRLVGQIAEALDYAHSRGIIHRDLKPSNVLLDKDGNAYLADFGVARTLQQHDNLTGSRIIGTPPYVAPEMVRKGEQVTGSVDIYGLGIITYQMLTGEPPYIDDDPMAVLMAHVLEPIPSARDFDPNIPLPVDLVIQRCLAKTPKARYLTATEYATALAEAVHSDGVHRASPPVPGTADTPPRERKGVAGAPAARPAVSRIQQDTPPSGEHQRVDFDRQPAKEKRKPRRRGDGLLLIVLGVIAAIVIGVGIAAYFLTDGNPGSLLAILTPIPTRTLHDAPTATAAVGGEPVVEPSTGTAVPVLLPPPSGGDRLAFSSDRDGDFEIYLIDIDGSNLRQLTDNGGSDFDADWSPDGRQIVFARRETLESDSEIVIMNADGSDPRQITDNDFDDTDPAWSPDGEWIAFSSNRDGDADIYLMRVDGSDLRQLTENSDRDDLTPRWSPDGSRIGYHARLGNNRETSEIYIMDAGGGAPYQLTSNDRRDEWLDWAPDGQRVAFSSGMDLPENQRAVIVFDLLTSTSVRVTVDGIHDDDPTWSPDGGRIAFDSDRDGGTWFDLYVLDIASGVLQQLTSTDAHDVVPVWQPR